jgi:hypothetical protein
MRRGQAHTKLLIVAGALAAIATGTQGGWELDEKQDLVMATIDAQTPSARYLIHAELHGPDRFDADGFAGAFVSVLAHTPSPSPVAEASIEIRSLTRPEQMPALAHVRVTDTQLHHVYLPAWLECATDPCSEDFELTIKKRDPLVDAPVLDVSGWAQASADGTHSDLPPGTNLVITVTGPVP